MKGGTYGTFISPILKLLTGLFQMSASAENAHLRKWHPQVMKSRATRKADLTHLCYWRNIWQVRFSNAEAVDRTIPNAIDWTTPNVRAC